MTLDVVAVVNRINDHLESLGYTPRDADGNDFQHGTDSSLRFKTGTSYGEVAIQVYVRDAPTNVIRITTEAGIGDALDDLSHLADSKAAFDEYASDNELPGMWSKSDFEGEFRGGGH